MATTTKKTTSRRPAKKPTDRQPKKSTAKKASAPRATAPSAPSDVAAFKVRAQGDVLGLPSGLAVRARRTSLEELVITGSVPNPLMAVVNEALEKGSNANLSEMVSNDEGEVDLDTVREMFTMVNEVVVEAVVSPKIHPVPEDGDKDDDLLYVDEVDPVDKMFIFQWCIGGTDDLERFREEFGSDMATLEEIQGSGPTS